MIRSYVMRCARNRHLWLVVGRANEQRQRIQMVLLRESGRYLPSQRGFQPPDLGFAAFDHLFLPNQMAERITLGAPKTIPTPPCSQRRKLFNSSSHGGGIISHRLSMANS